MVDLHVDIYGMNILSGVDVTAQSRVNTIIVIIIVCIIRVLSIISQISRYRSMEEKESSTNPSN